MVALKEFANFINLNLANLAATYARLLAESSPEFEALSVDSRLTSARKLLKAVVTACDKQASAPLLHFFDGSNTVSNRRWAEHIAPSHPLLEVECLGQTLTPVVPNLEAGKFLWQILFELRHTVDQSNYQPITERKQSEMVLSAALSETQALYEVNQAVASGTTTDDMLAGLLTALNNNGIALGADSVSFSRLELDQAGRPVQAQVIAWWFKDREAPSAKIGVRYDLNVEGKSYSWLEDPSNPVLISDGKRDVRESGVFVRDTGIRARAILPLVVANRWVGLLSINFKETQTFTSNDERLYRILMGQLATVIENRRLFDQAQERVIETEMLYRAGIELSTANTLDAIIDVLQQYTLAGWGDHVNLNYFEHPWSEEKRPQWVDVLVRHSKLGEDPFENRYALSDEMAHLLRPNAPVAVEDIATHPEFGEENRRLFLNQFGVKSVIFVPLVVANRWLGFVMISFEARTTFLNLEIRRLTALTGQAAVAIQNIHNLEQTQRRIRRERTIREITDKMRTSTSLEKLVEVTTTELGQRFSAEYARLELGIEDQK